MQTFFCFTPHKATSDLFEQMQAGRAIDGPEAGAEAFLSGFRACCPLPRFPEAHRRVEGWKGEGARQRIHHSRCPPLLPWQPLFPGAAPRRLTSVQSPGHGRCQGTPGSLRAAGQGTFRPSQRFRCRRCSLPWMLLGNPAGCWVQLQSDTERWEGTELYS